MTKIGPTSDKLQQKLFMLNWTPKGVFFNISKVLRNPSGGRLSFLAIRIGAYRPQGQGGSLKIGPVLGRTVL